MVEIARTPVAWRAYGPVDANAVVLVHGGAANQHWWDAVLPGLDPARRIVTFDLSGHGASGHRARYGAAIWSRELEAVIVAATGGRATVVAHSMGGRLALAAVPALRERLEMLILLDVPLKLAPDPELLRKLRQPRKVYATEEEAVRAFRVVPGTVRRLDVARQVAAASIQRNERGGWIYRGDPTVVGRIPNELVLKGLSQLRAPVAVIRGAASPFDEELCLDLLSDRPGVPAPVITLAHTGHHLMLDSPDELAASIEELIERCIARS